MHVCTSVCDSVHMRAKVHEFAHAMPVCASVHSSMCAHKCWGVRVCQCVKLRTCVFSSMPRYKCTRPTLYSYKCASRHSTRHIDNSSLAPAKESCFFFSVGAGCRSSVGFLL